MNQIDPTPLKERTTIRTVAADAGVSVAAVSKVLRNAYGVSDSLRQRVQTSIDRLGYRPSVAARGMRGKTYAIGVLLVEIANPFLPSVIAGLQEVAGLAGYKVLMAMGEAKLRLETPLIESMIDQRMDGLILVAPQMSGSVLEAYASQIPIVVFGHHEADATGYDTINNDDFAGAQLAVRALIDRGYRDIAMSSLTKSDWYEVNVAYQRELGYLAAMRDAGLGEFTRIERFTNGISTQRDVKTAYLRSAERPRALFCWSDLDAVVTLDLAHQIGLRVPQDLAIIGYDNSPPVALSMVNLATIDQSGHLLGSLSAEALLGRIAGRAVPIHQMVTPTLVLRPSI